jgi:hypothetical protein
LRARRFRRDRRGVVSTVGTLLSMLVFFALFGVFLTQYLPLWMLQNESLFVGQAQSSMESLKQSVDDQAIFGYPQTYSVPFTMDSQGIPLFAQPTQGTVLFLSGGCTSGFTPSASAINVTPTGSGACTFEHLALWAGGHASLRQYQNQTLTTASNYLEMQLPNRYFPSEVLFFENDAVIATQNGNRQLLLAAPPLNISHTGCATPSCSNTTVSSSFLQLAGYPSAVATQGTKDVYSSLISNGSYSSHGRFTWVFNNSPAPFNVTFSIGTVNVCAWYSLLWGISNVSGLAPASTPPSGWSTGTVLTATGPSLSVTAPTGLPSSVCNNPRGFTYDVTLTVYNVNYATGYSGVSQITFSQGGL